MTKRAENKQPERSEAERNQEGPKQAQLKKAYQIYFADGDGHGRARLVTEPLEVTASR
jgi:hypothetical protein